MPGKHVNPWLVLVLVCLAQFMVVLDATVVNVALPSIRTDLEMDEADLQWVVNAYTLVFGGFLLLGGRAGDLLGRKRIFLAGVVLFTVASLLDGLAQSSTMLILARGLQGLGGALVSPAALSIVNTIFDTAEERTKALGVWSAIAAGGAAVGLLLGGILTDFLSWPWVFFVNVPVGIATFVLSARLIPESRGDVREKGFDIPGAVTVTAGLIALVYAIVRTAEHGWTDGTTLAVFAAAALLLLAFLVIENRSAGPLMRLSIFKVPTLRAANVSMLLVACGLFAMFFFTSLYTQGILGYSPLEGGAAFLPFTLGIIIGAGAAQSLLKRVDGRLITLVGLVIAALGMLWLVRLEPDGSYLPDLLPSILPTSIGMGLAFVPITLIGTAGLPAEDAGLASGLFNTSQQIGGSIGLAILSTISAGRILDASGGEKPDAEALVHGYRGAFFAAALLVALGAVLLLLLLRRRHLEAIELGGETAPATAG